MDSDLFKQVLIVLIRNIPLPENDDRFTYPVNHLWYLIDLFRFTLVSKIFWPLFYRTNDDHSEPSSLLVQILNSRVYDPERLRVFPHKMQVNLHRLFLETFPTYYSQINRLGPLLINSDYLVFQFYLNVFSIDRIKDAEFIKDTGLIYWMIYTTEEVAIVKLLLNAGDDVCVIMKNGKPVLNTIIKRGQLRSIQAIIYSHRISPESLQNCLNYISRKRLKIKSIIQEMRGYYFREGKRRKFEDLDSAKNYQARLYKIFVLFSKLQEEYQTYQSQNIPITPRFCSLSAKDYIRFE